MAACGSPATGNGEESQTGDVGLSTWAFDPEEGYPTGEVSGSLVVDGDCTTLSVGDTNYLLVWPSGHVRQGDQVIDSDGAVVASNGDDIRLGGGEGSGDVAIQGGDPDCGQTAYWLVVPIDQ